MAELGVAYLSIIPETSKLKPGIRKALRDSDATLTPEVDQNAGKAIKRQVEAAVKKSPPQVAAEIDTASVKAEVDRLQRDLKSKKLQLEASTAQVRKTLAELKGEIAKTKAAIKVNADDNDARAKLKRLEGEQRDLQLKLEADSAPARAEIEALRAEYANKKVELDVDVDTSSLSRANRMLGNSASIANRSSLTFGQMAIAAGTLGTALIPAAAAAGGLAAALAAPLAAAGGGATIWGLLAGAVVTRTAEQYKEIEEMRKKIGGLEKGTKEYAEAQAKLKEMTSALSPAQKRFTNSLDRIKERISLLAQGQTGAALLDPLSKGMNIAGQAMKKAKPIIVAVSDVLSGFLDRIGRFVRSSQMDSFVAFFAKNAPPAMRQFGNIVSNVAVGVAGLVQAFTPMGGSVLGWIEGVTRKFRNWGQEADNNGVQDFLRYVREIGPQVRSTLGAVGRALGKILLAGAPIGNAVLKGIEAFANAIAALPTKVLTGFVVALASYKVAALLAGGATRALTRGLGNLVNTRLAAFAAGVTILTSGLGSLDRNASKSDRALGGLKSALGGAAIGFAGFGPKGAVVGAAVGGLYALAKQTYDTTDGFRSAYRQAQRLADVAGGRDKKGGLSTALRGAGAAAKWGINRLLGNSDATKKMRKQQQLSISSVDALRDSINKQSGALTRNTRQMILKDFADQGGLKSAQRAGLNFGLVSKALRGNARAYERLKNEVQDTTGKSKGQIKAGRKVIGMIGTSNREVNEAQQNQFDLNKANRLGKKPMKKLGDEASVLAGKNRRLGKAVRNIPANPTISYKSTGWDRRMEEAQALVGELQNAFNPGNWGSGDGAGLASLLGSTKPHRRKAKGGPIFGPGTATSDSIPARLSDGEYVIQASAVDRYGIGLFDALNAQKFARGGPVGGALSNVPGSAGYQASVRLTMVLRQLMAAVKQMSAGVKQLSAAARHFSVRGNASASKSSPRVPKPSGPSKRRGGQLGDMRPNDPRSEGIRLQRADRQLGGRKNLLQGFEKPFKKAGPTLKGFQKGMKRSRDEAQRLNVAVKKGNSKQVRDWVNLRNRGLKPLQKHWKRTYDNNAKAQKHLQGFVVKSNKRVGTNFKSFRSGPLKGFATDWRNRFRKQTPSDVGDFRKKVNTHMGGTRDNIGQVWRNGIRPVLRDFGQYGRKHVAPAFSKGVDAIGAQWDRVERRMRTPVKYAVNTVLNKGLLAAFNKIAKFVDTDTIKPIKLPKGFARGGYTGPGDKYKPAGVVHAGEYVINKDATSKIQRRSPGLLDNLNRSGSGMHRRPLPKPKPGEMPGYWVGGGVAPIPGMSTSPSHGTNYEKSNWASDHGVPVGTPIRAWKEGRVVKVKQSNVSYGNETVINHPDNEWTRYAHQLKQMVSAGMQVARGQVIGLSGNTGNSRGPHLHLEIGGGSQPFSGGQGFAPALPGWAQKIMDGPKKWARGLLDGGGKLGGGFGGLVQETLNKLIAPSAAWATGELGSFAPAGYNGPMSGSVMRFVPTVKQVLRALGEPAGPTLVDSIMARMQKESGGNVGIVNNWDSNAAKGTPSVGLMQVIGPTYQANKPRPDKGPYKHGTSIDPYSNIYAGLHYARGRYGSIYSGMTQPGGYDQGGWLKHGDVGVNRSGKPEPVFTNSQWQTISRYVPKSPGEAKSRSGPQQIVGTFDISPNGQATIRGWAAQEYGSEHAYQRTVERQWR